MDYEVQLISDEDGLAVIGDPRAVELFVLSEGLPSRELGLHRLRSVASYGAGVAQAGSEIAANSGRWVQMTEESAQLVKKFGLMQSKDTGLAMGVIQAKGQAHGIKGIVQFTKGPGSVLKNPAIVAGAGAIMAQVAMEQAIAEIVDYLATIDEKVDDLLRAQKDAALADMIGVDLVIEEAMTIRHQVGRVSEVTWSKVQATAFTIARTQAYALRRLDALAEKVDRKSQVGDLAKVSKEAEVQVREWLAVLAHCFQLQDAIAVLELDRVLDSSPGELDGHRLALKAARHTRLDHITRSTLQLVARMSEAASAANAKVLLHPVAAKAVVESSNAVASGVVDFHTGLGIDRTRQDLEAKRWREAASEAKDRILETGSDGVEAVKRAGTETFDRVSEVFRSVDLDGDGIPDKPRALSAVEDAGSAIKGAALGVGRMFRRQKGDASAVEDTEPSTKRSASRSHISSRPTEGDSDNPEPIVADSEEPAEENG